MFHAFQRLRASPWLGLFPIAIAFVFMAWRSWRKWPDLLIDFGNQLYIPWQLSTGQVLYRDIAYLPGGPLSQYFNALLFKLFTPSWQVLLAANFTIAGLLVIFIYCQFQRAAGRLTATAIGLSIVVGFAFSQYLDVGNYNYISPYAHEALHGLFLSTLLVGWLAVWLRNHHGVWLGAAGFNYGLIFLTKPEFFLAASATSAAAFWFAVKTGKSALHFCTLFFSACLLPVTACFCFFLKTESFFDAGRSTVWAWVPLLTTNISQNQFYQTGLGLDQTGKNVILMLTVGVGTLAAIGLVRWRLTLAPNRWERLAWLVGIGLAALSAPWLECGRALPLLTLGGLVWLFQQWPTASAERKSQFVFPLLWLFFALFLLAKMGLNPRVFHYGIFLAMPAFIGAVWFLLSFTSRPHAPSISPSQTAFLLFLLIGLLKLAGQSELYYRDKSLPVGPPSDQIITYAASTEPAGKAIQQALAWIQTHTHPEETLAVLPEGAMLNYLSRRRNSTPYLVFMAEISAFGEETMFAAYRKNPPDYIALLHRDSSEYGPRFFGQEKGYGQDMRRWISENYEPVFLIGHEPLQTEAFGLKLFKKRSPCYEISEMEDK